VIHHGGCNTTGEALRAGVPQVVVPTFADSPFWAAQVRSLGVAAEPVPFREFTAERLETSLRVALTDVEMRSRATTVAEKVRAERGAEDAARILEDWVEHWRGEHRPAATPA
jgi:O-mycaminosyltylonolide 6-deoxyallosyltransferase